MQKVPPSPHSSHSHDSALLQKSINLRTPLNHQEVPFIVLWSQKSGCTVILKWFLYHAGLLDEALQYKCKNDKLDIHNYENQVLKAKPGYKQSLIEDILGDKPAINFLRCPYQRAFSSFLQVNQPNFLRLASNGRSTPGMDVRHEILRHVYGEDVSIEHAFSFLEYLRWLKNHTGTPLNPHHAPQHTPLYDMLQLSHFRLEDFNGQTHKLEQEFGLRTSITSRELLSSEHHRAKTKMGKKAALAFLEDKLPLDLPVNFQFPEVTGKLLVGTELGDLIAEIFEADLLLYKSVTPKSALSRLAERLLDPFTAS